MASHLLFVSLVIAVSLFLSTVSAFQPSFGRSGNALRRASALKRDQHSVVTPRGSFLSMSLSSPKVGIIGATGAVGEELLQVLEARKFPASSLRLYASERSSGKQVNSEAFGKLVLEPFSFEAAKDLDIALLAVGGDFALEWAEKLTAAGVVVIDNSSAFRNRQDIPLVVPEIVRHWEILLLFKHIQITLYFYF